MNSICREFLYIYLYKEQDNTQKKKQGKIYLCASVFVAKKVENIYVLNSSVCDMPRVCVKF